MKPDIAAAIATPAEAQWVEAELVRSLMRTARNTQLVGLLLIPIFVGVLWNERRAGRAAAVGAGGRWRSPARASGSSASTCARSWPAARRSTWPSSTATACCGRVSALVWGLSTLLYFDRSSLADQFICWLIMAGLAMFSINSLSSHLRTLRAYLDTLALTALGVMLWRIGVELRFHGPVLPLLDHGAAGDLLAGAAAGRPAPARDAPQELRAAVPQQPADRVAHAADAGGAGCGGDQEPLPGQRRARHPPAGACAGAVRRLAGQRAGTGARNRAQDRASRPRR